MNLIDFFNFLKPRTLILLILWLCFGVGLLIGRTVSQDDYLVEGTISFNSVEQLSSVAELASMVEKFIVGRDVNVVVMDLLHSSALSPTVIQSVLESSGASNNPDALRDFLSRYTVTKTMNRLEISIDVTSEEEARDIIKTLKNAIEKDVKTSLTVRLADKFQNFYQIIGKDGINMPSMDPNLFEGFRRDINKYADLEGYLILKGPFKIYGDFFIIVFGLILALSLMFFMFLLSALKTQTVK